MKINTTIIQSINGVMVWIDSTPKKTQMTRKYFKMFEISTSLASRKCNVKLLWYLISPSQRALTRKRNAGVGVGWGWEDGTPCTVLVEVWAGAILEVSTEVTQNIESRRRIWPSCVAPGCVTEGFCVCIPQVFAHPCLLLRYPH